MTVSKSGVAHNPVPKLPCRNLLLAVFAGLALLAPVPAAHAIEIQKITTPSGINAWLVEDNSLPLISMRFGFQGAGAAQDPKGKEGLANLMSALLDEGAGDLTSEQFRERLENQSIKLSFRTGRDDFGGMLEMLSIYQDEAFELLDLAMNQPRFDRKPFDRISEQIRTGIKRSMTNPESVAWKTMAEVLYLDHPYRNQVDGTLESLSSITPDDLKEAHKRLFSRNALKIAVVGDISADSLAGHLEKVFMKLPEKTDLAEIEDIVIPTGMNESVYLDVPQTVIRIALPGVLRNDPDFFPAFVMTHILGGGTFTSWLYQEIREKRGLTYGVSANLVFNDHTGILAGGLETRNENTDEAIRLFKQQLEKMAVEGPTQEELDLAKMYLTGSYALRFDTSGKIARQLLGIQMGNFDVDYVNTRNDKVNAVTLEDIKRVSKRLLLGIEPSIVIVGRVSD